MTHGVPAKVAMNGARDRVSTSMEKPQAARRREKGRKSPPKVLLRATQHTDPFEKSLWAAASINLSMPN